MSTNMMYIPGVLKPYQVITDAAYDEGVMPWLLVDNPHRKGWVARRQSVLTAALRSDPTIEVTDETWLSAIKSLNGLISDGRRDADRRLCARCGNPTRAVMTAGRRELVVVEIFGSYDGQWEITKRLNDGIYVVERVAEHKRKSTSKYFQSHDLTCPARRALVR